MSWRTVIISTQSKLDYTMGYLVVRGAETTRVFLDEIAVMVVENPAVSLTGCLIEALTEKKVKVIFCDRTRSPVAELVPHHGSHDSSAKIRTQARWTPEVKAVIWREIVTEKIRNQSQLLSQLGRNEQQALLQSYIGQVELLDATNREGHAAKVYFNALFGMDFTRSADLPINAALNYGYSLLLSAFSREITACGYLTQLGIFHDNTYNSFNLSCDLMEPFRVLVDAAVYSMHPLRLDKEEKHTLWQILNDSVWINDSTQTVLNAVRIYTHSVLDAINDNDPGKILFMKRL